MSLAEIAKQMVAPGKGILAADESTGTIEKRFTKIAVPSTEDNRRAYREMLFTTPGFGEYISGVIMYDETIRQSAKNGKTFVQIQQEAGVLPGIKVDQGTKDMDGSTTLTTGGSPNEKVTKGLEGLPERLKEYASLGAKFAKWRAVITIEGTDLPTDANIRQNAKDLAAYAKACQEADIVPMVEPEVLMDGSHTAARCAEVSEKVLTALFEELAAADVAIEGTILKTNMVVPGKESGEKKTPDEVAEATLALFKKILPPNLPGQAFLSGGQSEIEATENLNAMNARGPHPWNLSFSYGRALQDSALKKWAGSPANVAAAQKVLAHRAKMNGLATEGKYSKEMENERPY
ncbi:fructose-bisphosphate aldolase [Candidatus Kaiserbacteria bacterium RIFCSPHIGHO2_01_FULL_54_36]|uniref:Probable fructose-bisphosphate aldolase class 1 n=1 Tax=Candidatus Kaiserbacteria bacterium RIFCSPHIGHO2_01_FULL_54_36 TaxID=1798482 RepID=A0A1F6CMD2_9BACT|nr:MAG: fructose-bisphosphate aldolase [Candidatus Kaiserbacteria bacterium RIFCSPHIGHO2_01_FULL_54_36]OGG75746.1 MAG: fructose-bisphosphate aldolase [Candidatus Kaiserbacteria bacterium RIFCSPLOWO2_01_FULL_54_22]